MDEDMLLMILKAVLFVVTCVTAGMVLAHWIIWG
jgi:hypothetical protein